MKMHDVYESEPYVSTTNKSCFWYNLTNSLQDMNKTKSFLTTLGETAKAITIALAGVYLGERMFMASDRPVWRKRG